MCSFICSNYQYSNTTTDSDPGAGTVRFNHGTFGSITEIYIDDTDTAGTDFQGWLRTWNDSNGGGTLTIQSADSTDATTASVTVTAMSEVTG